MFKEIGQMVGLMKNLPKIREEMDKLQGRLGQITVEGDAGAGMVKVSVNGHLEILNCKISDDVFKNDKEFLEDLIVAAVNDALKKARKQVAEEASKVAGGMGIGGLSGLGGLGGAGSSGG